MADRRPALYLEGARVMGGKFRNFAGEARQYNNEGVRNFCVVIEDEDLAQQLLEDTWDIRVLAPREEGDRPLHYLPIEISYKSKSRPPKVVMVTERGKKTELDQESLSTLDYAEIISADLTINPWESTRRSGDPYIKAYLQEMYVTIEEDHWASKYDFDSAEEP